MTNILDTFNKATSVGRFAIYFVVVLFGAGITWGFAQSGISENKEKNIQQDYVISEIRRDVYDIKTKSAVQGNDIEHIRKNVSELKQDSKKQTQLLQEILINQKKDSN